LAHAFDGVVVHLGVEANELFCALEFSHDVLVVVQDNYIHGFGDFCILLILHVIFLKINQRMEIMSLL
jgi:hypothetical protein